MFHSVTICGKNTWDNYHMVPVDGIYLPEPPEQKVNTIEIPSCDGYIDISNVLTGYPVFNNRSGDLAYYMLDPWDLSELGISVALSMPNAYENYSNLMADIHGQIGSMFFEDDSTWEYKGRFTVSSFTTNDLRRQVNIHYDVAPYKTKRTTTSFTITANGTSSWVNADYTPTTLGYMPTNPTITIAGLSDSQTATIKIIYPDSSGSYTNPSRTLTKTTGLNGSFKSAELVFYKNARFSIQAPSGVTATFTFNQGRF